MPRRRIISQRKIVPDAIFSSELLSKFINIIMFNGKKSIATNIVYSALKIVSEKRSMNIIDVFSNVLENIKPIVEVKSRRVGGSTYQVPVEVRPTRRNTLAMKWLVHAARKRNEKSMILKLAHEMFDAINKKGNAIKKKEEVHRMAEANKAFAHYRW
ncbi:30S ribosomal protein S7 [Enterobacteriaceae endosymbiont of Macroplea appendiculata]|uniref:30S ribosomal protein S7 n=1 Tax=Enterobacteriaceae endosymbiont of Macroplea appendiculata TaxID=2675790 RepID=UPI0014496640|nr:30S ribosomal protein S7 [Enterobacteriaceae endosymbiont of Macroplea appendiculata]QJC30930.1 30S ribosomal protein S7 [Enterobacteriaceae endosymbiont of Macroplea appendiculata]